MTNPIVSPPTLDGFIAWSYWALGVPTTAMSPTDVGWAYAYQVALDLVPCEINQASKDIYTLTVYNIGANNLIQFQQDYAGQTFWDDARKSYGINNFVAGVINSASDEGTGESLTIGEGLQNLDLLSLNLLKTPWGRQALAYMQALGQSPFGIS